MMDGDNTAIVCSYLRINPTWLFTGKGASGLDDAIDLDSSVEAGPDLTRRVPLISYVMAGAWADAEDPYSIGDAEDWLPVPKKCGPRTFALRVRGVSMYNPNGKPSYEEGDYIFVDPDVEPQHRSAVIVRLDDEKEATFKQLIIEGDRRYLKALNPAWPEPIIQINGDATICGVVIGKWVDT